MNGDKVDDKLKTPQKRKRPNDERKSRKKQKKRDSNEENVLTEISLEDEFEFEEVSDRIDDMAGIESL